MMRIIGLVIGMVALSESAHAKCVAPFRFQLTSAGPWQAYGQVKSGTTCSGSFNSSGVIVFRRLFLASPPQHGSVRLQEGGRYFYSASAGYSGTDNFTLKVCGNQDGYEGCADIAYNMTVQ